jgi:hypothetical protein
MIPERSTQLFHGHTQATLEIRKRLVAPEASLQLFMGNQLPGSFEKHKQHLEGKFLNSDALTVK